jgi:small-conductance mechanosensitive channel
MNNTIESLINGFSRIVHYPLFTLGEVNLTLAVMCKVLFICTVVLVLESFLRRHFAMRLLKRIPLTAALQYAIARIGGYVFILLGFYIALTAVGINLSSLAVVAGAVGIGIGFGLQNIVHNIISGVIILAERPIALGDRIEVGGVAGNVTKIRLRSTEVVTNDNISIIVPNSDFITKPVTNWSHGDPRVQIRLPVRVAYGTDVEHLRRLLMEVADEHAKVLKSPASTVFFGEFGESALHFELGVWTSEMTHSPRRFRSELNFAIERKLREHGIRIPFPQRELHARTGVLPEWREPEPSQPKRNGG